MPQVRQYVYPSQTLPGGSVTELHFRLPRNADVWACGQSSLNLVIVTGAGTVGVLNASGLLPAIRSLKVSIAGRTVVNDVDLTAYGAFNVRTRVGRAQLRDVSKFQAGMNSDDALAQVLTMPPSVAAAGPPVVVVGGLYGVQSSTYSLVPDVLLSLREGNTNDSFVCAIPLPMLSSIFAQSFPMYLIEGDVEIIIVLELSAARLTLPLSAGTATALTLSQAYLFTAGFSYADRSILPDVVRHTYTQVQTTSHPSTGESAATLNISAAGERCRRLFIQWRQGYDTVYGASASRFDNANIYPTVNVLVDNQLYFNKPLTADYQAMQYTLLDASVAGYAATPGTLVAADAPLMAATSIDGTATAFDASAGAQNIIVLNLGPTAYGKAGAALDVDNFSAVGPSPIQVQISAPSGTLATATMFCHLETQKDLVFSRGSVEML